MKQTILISFLIVSTFASAQNYKTINPNRELYFVDTMTNIFTIKIDSIDVVNNNTSYYSFKTLREDTTTTAWDSCHYYVDDSWMGRKVIIKPNGYNIFINESYDSIFVNTQANLGDTFLLYTYSNNDYIKAIVSNIDTATVLGNLDSVKTFVLITNNTSFTLTPSEIKIGKESGLITLFSFFKFPNGNNSLYYQSTSPVYNYFNSSSYKAHYQLIGKSNPKIGVTKLTRREVFEFNIGDEFNYKYHNYDIPNPDPFKYHKILNKYFSISGDTVFYEIKRYEEYYQIVYTPSPPHIDTFLIVNDTTITSYANLNNYITDAFPEQHHYNENNSLSNYFVNLNIDIACNGKPAVIEKHLGFDYDPSNLSTPLYLSDCFNAAFEPNNIDSVYQKGLGYLKIFSYGPNSGQNWEESILGYRNTTDTCGVISTAIKSHENPNQRLSIYPNPTQNNFNYTINSNEKISLTIYNINSKIVLEKNNLNPTGQLNISTLKTGIYFVKSISSKDISTTKLIIN